MHSVAAGAWLTGSLIIAIGPQNLHVLRTGLVGRHVVLTVALCVAADALLLALALAGGLTALLRQPLVLGVMGAAGVLALATMAWRSLREAWRGGDIGSTDAAPAAGWRVALLRTLVVSLGNPAVWIETLFVVGATALALPASERPGFASGALAASALWFVALGFGARRLAPWLARPATLRLLAAISGLMLAGMAARLLWQLGPAWAGAVAA